MTCKYPDHIREASDEQIRSWQAATLGLSPTARWSDFVVAELILRIDEQRHKIRTLISERENYRHTAEQRVYVRQELSDLLGTENVDEAVRLIRAWKAAAMAGEVSL